MESICGGKKDIVFYVYINCCPSGSSNLVFCSRGGIEKRLSSGICGKLTSTMRGQARLILWNALAGVLTPGTSGGACAEGEFEVISDSLSHSGTPFGVIRKLYGLGNRVQLWVFTKSFIMMHPTRSRRNFANSCGWFHSGCAGDLAEIKGL